MVRADEDIVDFVHIPGDGDIGKWEVCFLCCHYDFLSVIFKVVLKKENMPIYMGSVSLHITFPPAYPFKPPSILIPTIYHPNVYVTGRLCIR